MNSFQLTIFSHAASSSLSVLLGFSTDNKFAVYSLKVLKRTGGNKSEAARMTWAISRITPLYNTVSYHQVITLS